MTTKDWMLLIVPIVSNGILIFVYQAIIKRKFDKIKMIDNRKKEIVENFLELLYFSMEIGSEVERKLRNKEDIKEINQKFHDSILELCTYGINMKNVLNESDALKELRDKTELCLIRINMHNEFGSSKKYKTEFDDIINSLYEIKVMQQEIQRKIIRL